jgi:HD domain-containing protein
MTSVEIAAIPDTAAARAAEVFLMEVSTTAMVRHCRRSFQLGMALGEKIGARPDVEVLYIGALLHDLGLEPRYEGEEGDFVAVSGREAEAFLRRGGHPEKLAIGVRAAIELHGDFASAKDPRPEVALLHLGATLDVIGQRLDDLSPALVERILAKEPRAGFAEEMISRLQRQIALKPGCKLATIFAALDIPLLIRSAPFAG